MRPKLLLNSALAIAAVALPILSAYNLPPSSTFFNQALAFIGWGAWLLLLCASALRKRLEAPPGAAVLALLGALFVLVSSALASSLGASLPSPLALSYASAIGAAALTMVCAATLGRSEGAEAFGALCIALIVAGVLSVALSLVQVFASTWADGRLLAAPTFAGRASGNLRQPNHLSSLLLWSVIATVWSTETSRLRRDGAMILMSALVFALVLTASRTGVVGVVTLALWGALDRRLSRSTRLALVLAPIAYMLFWAGLAAWAHATQQVFGGASRITDTAGGPNSRLRIWANTLTLISQHPWLGIGLGEFNFAWSLTPFPHRPTAFFDHTHNLPLQFAVDLGLPLASGVLALFAYALWRAFVAGRDAPVPQDVVLLRAAFMMVVMIAIHSLFEYPLWYAYFLLPTAFVWGLCLGADAPEQSATSSRRTGQGARALAFGALVLLSGAIGSVFDYLRVAAIFSADDDAVPLAQRIADGQRSWFFAHHAHYAAATTAERPSEAMPSFKIATHYLLDTRLMIAWANAFIESGDIERARHIAARLREFRNEDSETFFKPCAAPAQPSVKEPFQCLPPTTKFSFEDFR